MTEELTDFLAAEVYSARALDELDMPRDVLADLQRLGFETVQDIFDADPTALGDDARRALSAAFGVEGIDWGAADAGPTYVDEDKLRHDAIVEAVHAILDVNRQFQPNQTWPMVGWRIVRTGADVDLHLDNGAIVRMRLSAPLLLGGAYRAATLEPDVQAEFEAVVAFPRPLFLEEEIGRELVAAAHEFDDEGHRTEAVLLARRAVRGLGLYAEEIPEGAGGLPAEKVDTPLRDAVLEPTEVATEFAEREGTYAEMAEMVIDYTEHPDVLERYESAIALRRLFEVAPLEALVEFCDPCLEPLHRLAGDEWDAVRERALHAIHTAAHRLWIGRYYRSAVQWLELGLEEGVYPGETMRRLAECRLYTHGEIPQLLVERLDILQNADPSTYRGPEYDPAWRAAARVRASERLALDGNHVERVEQLASEAVELLLRPDERRTLELRGRALVLLGDARSAAGDREGAIAYWEDALDAFGAADLSGRQSEVRSRMARVR